MGIYNATAKGGSPKARVAAYKVCFPSHCYDADIIKAFDHAIDDGVDVISVSLGSIDTDYQNDGVAVGALSAVKHGITVVASAGNNGPQSGTVFNVAPWILTVAASTTDRDIFSYVHLQNGIRLKVQSSYPFLFFSFFHFFFSLVFPMLHIQIRSFELAT